MKPRSERHSFSDDSEPALVWERPEWWARAACLGVGPKQFFPDGNTAGWTARRTAAAFCDRCEAKVECGAASVAEVNGLWAGRLHQSGWRAQRAARRSG